LQLRDGKLGSLEVRQRSLGLLDERESGIRERQFACSAVQQLRPELLFELRNFPTHGGLGHAEQTRRAAKASCLRYADEHDGRVEIYVAHFRDSVARDQYIVPSRERTQMMSMNLAVFRSSMTVVRLRF
jgi:hypothetical protein